MRTTHEYDDEIGYEAGTLDIEDDLEVKTIIESLRGFDRHSMDDFSWDECSVDPYRFTVH